MLSLMETGIALLALLGIGWGAYNVLIKARISEALMADAKPYDALTTDFAKTLLVLGDSTAVGIGAERPEDTIAAKLAAHLGATYVENQAKSGAAVEDLSTQIQHLHLTHYDFILLQIGGNDILALHDASKTAKKLYAMLERLPDVGQVVIMTAGNVGGATIIPWLMRPFYTWATLAYHKEFARVAKEWGATYVNLYRRPWEDVFIKEPLTYLAADGLHPSSAGYAVWFETLKASI